MEPHPNHQRRGKGGLDHEAAGEDEQEEAEGMAGSLQAGADKPYHGCPYHVKLTHVSSILGQNMLCLQRHTRCRPCGLCQEFTGIHLPSTGGTSSVFALLTQFVHMYTPG